jgi:uncharacterized membrane protein YsdA (DUF1294 family)
MKLLIGYLFVVNCISFVLFGIDKRHAIKQQSRIPEKTLHFFTLAGGTLGAATGMLLFRHKTAKRSFLIVFFGILILQLCMLYFLK